MKQRRHLYFSSRIKEPFRRPFVVGFLWSLACWFSTQSMRAGSRRDISRRPCLQICKQRLLLLVALSINLFKFSCAANTKKYIYFSIDENKWEGLSWEKRGKELSRFTQRVSNQMLRRSANSAASWGLRQKKKKTHWTWQNFNWPTSHLHSTDPRTDTEFFALILLVYNNENTIIFIITCFYTSGTHCVILFLSFRWHCTVSLVCSCCHVELPKNDFRSYCWWQCWQRQ